MALALDAEFKGTERFIVRRRLGTGGFGVVYEAEDRVRAAPVALKTLKNVDAESLYRFKREFRELADIVHPNLVTLYELLSDGELWFLTMELIEGSHFLEYVRTGVVEPTATGETTIDPPRSFHEGRLRSALRQLADAAMALHRAGKLHRDLKPSNVLVTSEGRVVILDFGLVAELAPLGLQSSLQIAGTPAYMSPEQAAGLATSEASDWYAIGVMLYEALTGRLPFTGSAMDVRHSKLEDEPPPPAEIAPCLPQDLVALCVDLLRRRPEERPTGRDVLRRLAGDASRQHVALAPEPETPFVGRAQHLAGLRDAFETTLLGRPAVVHLRGGSGIGKTALAWRFLDTIERHGKGAVILAGRCYERESVPYKALDSLIDALSRYLSTLSRLDAEVLLPRDIEAVTRLFPVLLRVEAVARARRRPIEVQDPHELRRRAFAALRELWARLTDRRPLVLFIDDVQWGDLDSAALLAEVLRPPEPPPLLLVTCHRTEEEAASPFLRSLGIFEAQAGGTLDAKVVEVRELSPGEARELALALIGSEEMCAATARAEAIARESGGSPFFIDELVRLASPDGASREPTVSELIRARAGRLPGEALRLLEVVAVAGGPVDATVARRAAGLAAGSPGALAVLQAGRLARLRRSDDLEEIETYHDRIREAIVAQLSEESRCECHRRLAVELESSGRTDPEALLAHFQQAGERGKVVEYAARAAAKAALALAFDRAAQLYRMALSLGNHAAEDSRRLRLALADALANAGRGPDAADAYLEAAEGADPSMRSHCWRRAAEYLLGTGHLERGFGVLSTVLGEIGVRFPPTQRRSLVSLLWQRAKLRLRGLRWEPADEGAVTPRDLARIDVYHFVSATLSLIDFVRAADFAGRGLLLALRTGEPRRIARALALEAIIHAAEGASGLVRAKGLLAEAGRTVRDSRDPALSAHILCCTAMAACHLGAFRESVENAREAEALVLKLGLAGTLMSVSELYTLRLYLGFDLSIMGSFRELRRAVDENLDDARRRGDLHMETLISRGLNVAWLSADDPAGAEGALARASWVPPAGVYHLQHWLDLEARGNLELYRRGAGAFDRLARDFEAFERSVIARMAGIRAQCFYLRGRLALAEGRTAFADRAARGLERNPLPYAVVWSKLLRAGLAARSGDRAVAADILRKAIVAAEESDMFGCAAAARRRLGELLGGTEGARLVAQAGKWFISEDVKNPERLTHMLAPGFAVPATGEE